MQLLDVVQGGLLTAGVYLVVGVLFAVPFLKVGVKRIDPVAADGTRGFLMLILPGVVLLWPVLLRKWMSGLREPREESNAHRRAARAPEPKA